MTKKKASKGKGGVKGRRLESIRLSADRAASEWGIDHRTLAKAIRTQGIEPGSDGFFSVKDIDRAIHGDLDAEKLRLTREQADKHWLDNQRTRELLVERTKVAAFMQKLFVGLRQKIIASELCQEAQDEMLADIRSLKESPWVQEIDEPLEV